MADQRLVKLVADLYMKTQESQVNWKKTSDDSLFAVSFKSYSIQVFKTSETQEYHGEFDRYWLRILDSSGDVVEEIGDGNFEGNEFTMPPDELLRGIFESARRHAMGLNAAIDSILLELNPPKAAPADDDIPF